VAIVRELHQRDGQRLPDGSLVDRRIHTSYVLSKDSGRWLIKYEHIADVRPRSRTMRSNPGALERVPERHNMRLQLPAELWYACRRSLALTSSARFVCPTAAERYPLCSTKRRCDGCLPGSLRRIACAPS
jgi:hypothetical protein